MPTFTSTRGARGKYEYVIIHLRDGNSLEYEAENILDVDPTTYEGILVISMDNGKRCFYKEWASVDMQLNKPN